MASNYEDNLYKYLSEDKTVRASFASTLQVCEQLRFYQKLGPLATIGLGRAVSGALLLASHLKRDHMISLHFKGSGPLRSIYSESSYDLKVRGYCGNREYVASSEADFFKVGRALGVGILEVSKYTPGKVIPQVGMVEIKTGEIAEDIAYYQLQSEQIPSIVALAVTLDASGKVVAAGGFLVEAMPGVSDEVLKKLEHDVQSLKPLSHYLKNSKDIETILPSLFKSVDWSSVPQEAKVEYVCRCSSDKVLRTLGLLSQQERAQMIAENKSVEVKCEFCQAKYVVTMDDLKSLR